MKAYKMYSIRRRLMLLCIIPMMAIISIMLTFSAYYTATNEYRAWETFVSMADSSQMRVDGQMAQASGLVSTVGYSKNIQDYLKDRRVIVLTGVLADKDYADMYKPVMPLVEQFVCITPPNPRKLEAELLAQYLREVGATATPCESIEAGVRKAMDLAGKDGVVLCFGSLYSIGAIRDGLEAVG